MEMQVKEETGFSAVEMLLCLIIVIMVTFIGFFVYSTKQSANTSYNTATKVAQASAPKASKADATGTSTIKSLDIKVYGVKLTYSAADTYTYRVLSNTSVEILSKTLSDTYGCSTIGGGSIARGKPNEAVAGEQTLAAQASANPSKYKLINGYYYFFVHDQAACSNTVTPEAENAVNTAVAKLIPHLQAD